MKKMIPLLLLLLASCSDGIIDRNIEIEIRNAATDKIDLKKDRYTRFFSSKPPLEIKLGLTEEEKTKKAARIKKFIQLVRNIILSKPAVRNAPPSDVMYM